MSNKHQILPKLKNKKVIIWGARMTGIGAHRFLAAHNIPIEFFIDSDLAFQNNKVLNLEVVVPTDVKEKLDSNAQYVILVAVSLKEEEIKRIIDKLGLDGVVEVISFRDNENPYFTVDILSSCNLRCASCPHSIEDHDVPRGSMSLETFKEVFDKILADAPSISHISLYSWGEPLIHPHVAEIVEYVHAKNVAVALSSNLSIKFEDRIERLISMSPDYLKISVSGYYPTAYNNTHAGGDINLVKSNLYRLRYLLDKYSSNTVVDINYHLYRDNSGQNLLKFKELAQELNFIFSETYALVMPLERVLSHLEGAPDFQTKRLESNLLVTIDEGIAVSSIGATASTECPFRENQININADLTVPVCCTVFERGENVVAQNFLNASLSEIASAKSKVELCTKCTSLKLPEYNMGYNRAEWLKLAQSKTLNDVGSKSAPKVIRLLNDH
ncbi:MoaA/NifB/PqqE/SkfB family radical SAM enzyme [Jezberella montanilacus]|uniref:MoaA/NifB/PqqE/SkfB family radical SAM enzyme n=1 Tax=Jezberella montanilacus TaxID=323426 RepID=A0A2T0XIA1_9BURK|nr:radical SAM protein [Jezberella montanilacus]PRY98666.1 MoaA/NifB/PqqE/SkfB family radical SAM enzyme [Jezberella montanilacus]